MDKNREMDEHDWQAEQFERERPRLRMVAYRLLGSLSEADDAVQESWLHMSRSDSRSVTNLDRWLTTVVARVCLDMLRVRAARREEFSEGHLPDLIISREEGMDPEQAALLAESVGLALQVVLETLEPAERVAFVLHDVFALPFDEIAPLVGRSPMATRQLASRARRRIQGAAPVPDADLAQSRTVVDAFLAAVREGDFAALLAALDPDVVVRADYGATPGGAVREVRGARAAAEGAITFAQFARFAQPALVNGAVGVVAAPGGQLYAVIGFTVRQGKIVEIDILADPTRLRQLDLSALDERCAPPRPWELGVAFTVRRWRPYPVKQIAGKTKGTHLMAKTYRVTFAVRASNWIMERLLRTGVKIGPSRFPIILLTVRGRKSGQPRATPVVTAEYDGKRYLIGPFGSVNWVRNLRAAGEATITRGRRSEQVSVVELTPAEAAPILKQIITTPYTAQFTRRYFDVTPDSSLEEFEREAPRHPLFLAPSVAERANNVAHEASKSGSPQAH